MFRPESGLRRCRGVLFWEAIIRVVLGQGIIGVEDLGAVSLYSLPN